MVSDLVVSVILECNKLDIDMRSSTSINIFKKPLLQFVRPSPSSLFNCHSSKGIKYEIKSRLGLSHLREHKFKHSIQDTLNPFCDCGCEKEKNCSFSSSLPQFYTERNNLLSKIKSIDTSILNQNNSNFTKTLAFGDPVDRATIDTLTLLQQMLLLTLF